MKQEKHITRTIGPTSTHDSDSIKEVSLNTDYDYEAERQRNNLLLRLKKHYYSATIPRTVLYQVDGHIGKTFDAPYFAWSANDAMGSHSVSLASVEETNAANELLERGSLVRTFQIYSLGGEYLTGIELLEDVQWGLDEHGILHMYQLADGAGIPDAIAPMDERHDAAAHELQKRIEYGNAFLDERPLRLSNGLLVHPVVHGRSQKLLRDRQDNILKLDQS